MDNRPYVRWWWPGGDVEEGQLKADLALLEQSGFGGVEIQPLLLGLTPEEIDASPQIRTVGTPDFFTRVKTAGEEARRLGMGFDITLGSGWSTGVPNASEAVEKQLLMSSLEITGPTVYRGPLPIPEPPVYRQRVNAIMNVVGPFDEDLKLVAVTAARVIDSEGEIPVLDSFRNITGSVGGKVPGWDVPEGTWRVFAFYENSTSHAPVGAAYPGLWSDALIVDHFDAAGAQKLIDNYGDPLLSALGENTPDAIFIDSFEMVGELPWTTSFRDRFEREKGYDIAPYLPLMFQRNGESKYTQMTDLMGGVNLIPLYTSFDDAGVRVREDYEDVRGGLFIDEFLKPLLDWGRRNQVDLRIQAQGGWADYLDVYQMVDIPESEALFAVGSFDFLRLASSGAHISGARFVGSESFIKLSNDPNGIKLEDFYRLGGKALSAGINRVVYHGFPYTYVRENGKDWYPLSGELGTLRAGPISFTSWIGENHPAWLDLPAFNDYLARLSYAMSCGEHKAEIAWLYPDWEFPDNPMDSGDESEISLSLKRAGFVYDRISRRNLTDAIVDGDQFTVGAAQYEALLISDLETATPEMMIAIEEIVDAGIPVIVVGELPHRAPGYSYNQRRDAGTQEIATRLQSKVISLENQDSVGAGIIQSGVQPAIVPSDGSELIFAPECRQVPGGYLIMLFNESDEKGTQRLDILLAAHKAQVLDPQTGTIVTGAVSDQSGRLSVEVNIPAGRSVVLFIGQ